ncbi:MAG: glycoside hydrolase family 5 protein [Spirosomaceae bacterium]|nr:glycoside hydrolase family 5 protein [Spirosomataceae bacterium]
MKFNLNGCNVVSLVLLTSVFWIGCEKAEPAAAILPPPVPIVEKPLPVAAKPAEISGVMIDISSFALVAEMGVGWNLGNSFDVRSKDKTVWGNPLSSVAIVQSVKAMGFTSLRIPITWNFDQLQSAPYTIELAYLERIKVIVDEALKNDMYVIINTHHDDWIVPTNASSFEVKNRLAAIWKQVAVYFQSYGDHLIFETLNEPRLMGSAEEWNGGTQEGRDNVNAYHKAGVDAIRATAGNNAKRQIMLSTYAASSAPNAMGGLVVPNNDPNIIISIHSYFPWSFAGDIPGVSTWGSDAEKKDLENELDRIRDKWIVQEKRPVVLGEWGTTNKSNLDQRVAYSRFYAAAAVKRGFVPIIWDDGGNFGFFNRNNLTWKYPEIAKAVLEAKAK